MHGFGPKMPPLARQGKGLGLKPTTLGVKGPRAFVLCPKAPTRTSKWLENADV